MSSGFRGNGFNDKAARVSNPIAVDEELPFLAEELTKQFTHYTRRLFSASGPYKVNTRSAHPVVSITPGEPKGPFLSMIVRSHWDDKILDRQWEDPRDGLIAYYGDVKSIFDRGEGQMVPMVQNPGFKLAFKPGAMFSVCVAIKEQKCPHLSCLEEPIQNMEGILRRIVSGPGKNF